MDTKVGSPLMSESASSSMVPAEESVLLSDGRTLSYSQCGDFTSSKVIIFFHGVFGIGVAENAELYQRLGYRSICPTLPGWGTSSPWPKALPLSAFAADIAVLLRHAMGDVPLHTLVVGGGSYGTVWAYSVAANKPPEGFPRLPEGVVKGLLILGGFSPFREHVGYTEQMTWLNWLTVSRPSLYFPLRLLHPFAGRLIASKVKGNIEGSLQMLRQIITGPKAMTAQERKEVEDWAKSNGSDFEQWEWKMARNMSLSLLHTMEGYYLVPHLLNADWGFKLGDIRIGDPAEHPTIQNVPDKLPPVVIVGAQRDHLAPLPLQRYVARNIPGAQLLELPGNHISVITAVANLITALVTNIRD